MLTPDTLLDIIKNFLFFRVEFGNATKVVTRYMHTGQPTGWLTQGHQEFKRGRR